MCFLVNNNLEMDLQLAGLWLRFEITRIIIVAITGTKNGGGTAILAHSAKSG